MQWLGIWNHWQPVTIALVDPDFDSRLKSWFTLLAYTNHTIMQWLRLHTHPNLLAHQCGAHIRCLNHFTLHMQWLGIWNHWQPVTIALVDPDFDSQLKAWVTLLGYTNHTIMQ
jgi:hypothetical protein